MVYMRYSPYQIPERYGRIASGNFSSMFDKSSIGSLIGQKYRYIPPGSRTKTKTKRRRTVVGGSGVINAIRAHETAQHYSQSLSKTIGSNADYCLNPVGAIALGNSNTTRTNDEIFIECLKYNYTYEQAATSSNGQKFRFVLLYADDDIMSSGTAWATNALVAATIAQLNTASINYADIIFDPKKVTVIHDETIVAEANYSGSVMTKCNAGTIQIKKPFIYKPASAYGKTRNLYLWLTGTGSFVGDGTALGDFVLSYDLIFKNSK